jgi:flavin reductase (DIM6/NTAB) family NADH-FMN oxidoreductase RutF
MIWYGPFVPSARIDGGANAATAGCLNKAAIEPPRIVVAPRNDTGIWHRVRRAGTFAENVRRSRQKLLASFFLRRVEPEGNVLEVAALWRAR